MRTTLFGLLLGALLVAGCDDDADTDVLPGPSSGSTVAPPPPVTPETQPATRPVESPADEVIE